MSPLHRENGLKNFPDRKNTGNLEIFAQTQGVLFAQVVNFLILKMQDIVIFAKFFIFAYEISEIGTDSFPL